MPYKVRKDNKGEWCLEKVYDDAKKNYIINKRYKSRQMAINAAKNFIKFRRGKPLLKGNMIINNKPKKSGKKVVKKIKTGKKIR